MTLPKKKRPACRLDNILVDKALFPTRHKAEWAIRSGNVIVDNSIVDKPGKLISPDSNISIKEKPPFVSRGGLKLLAAIKEFNINVKDKTALDIGSSTGGFTDCLLKYGAARVYSIDVGYGQLALELRNDPRVVVMEKINARYLKLSQFPIQPDLAVIDVSFISLSKIIPAVSGLLPAGSHVIALIKPQFEAGIEFVKKGVVKDPAVHREVIQKIKETVEKNNLKPLGVIPSPILGPKGNKEFLLHMIRT